MLVTTIAPKVSTKGAEMWAEGWSPVEFYNTTGKPFEHFLGRSFNPMAIKGDNIESMLHVLFPTREQIQWQKWWNYINLYNSSSHFTCGSSTSKGAHSVLERFFQCVWARHMRKF